MASNVEALFRPVVEFWSALLAALMAAFTWLLYSHLMMTPPIARAAALFFGTYGIWRGAQTLRLKRFQRHLTDQPRYALKPREIPCSTKWLFLGRGFRWERLHAQRMYDLNLPGTERYRATPAREFRRELSRALETLPGLSGWSARLAALENPVGGRPEIHGIGMYEGETKVYAPISERVGHTLVLGTTRVGKTRLAELLIQQDIRRGDTVIVFDPKGDADLLRSVYVGARLAGRLDHFYVFHLAHPEYSARYNPVGSYSKITEVANRIANQLPDSGNSAAFKEFGWRFTNIIARAMSSLNERPTLEALRRYVIDIEPLLIRYLQRLLELRGPRDWRAQVNAIERQLANAKNTPREEQQRGRFALALTKYVARLMAETSFYDATAEGLLSAFKYDRTYFDKIVSSLGPLLEKLTTGKVSELLSPNYDDPTDPRPIFDWRSIIRQNGIVYVGLAALSDVTVAGAVGNSMFQDLTAVAGDLYSYGADRGLPPLPGGARSNDYSPVSVHADEFNELIGPEFVPLLNKAGGAKFQVSVYTQTWSDVEAKIGSRAKAEQVLGNLNTLIMMRVKNEDTAKILTMQLPMAELLTRELNFGVTDTATPDSAAEFRSSASERIKSRPGKLLNQEPMQLPKGHAFALIEGGHLYKIRLPLPEPDPAIALPKEIAALMDRMKQDYARAPEAWAQDEWWSRARAPAASVFQEPPAAPAAVPVNDTPPAGGEDPEYVSAMVDGASDALTLDLPGETPDTDDDTDDDDDER